MFRRAQPNRTDEVHQFPQTALIEGRASMAFRQDVFQMRVFPLDFGHGLVDALADVRLFGGGLDHMPACRCRHPKDPFRRVFVAVFCCVRSGLFPNDFRMPLGKAVRDVLQENEAQYHLLVVGGVQMPTQLVGGGPELGFEALVAGIFGFGFLGWSARHGVPFAFVVLYHEKARWLNGPRLSQGRNFIGSGNQDMDKVRPDERDKIWCGVKHFEALSVDYAYVVSGDEV